MKNLSCQLLSMRCINSQHRRQSFHRACVCMGDSNIQVIMRKLVICFLSPPSLSFLSLRVILHPVLEHKPSRIFCTKRLQSAQILLLRVLFLFVFCFFIVLKNTEYLSCLLFSPGSSVYHRIQLFHSIGILHSVYG